MRLKSAFATVVLALVVAGCKSEHEKVMSSMLDTMEETAAVMKSITDASSGRAAAPKLKALGDEARKLTDRARTMKDLPADEEKRLSEKYEARLKTAMEQMMSESARISMNPSLHTPELREALDSLRQSPRPPSPAPRSNAVKPAS